jgi:hypothetical protein
LKIFEQEYGEYLDILLGDEQTLLTINLVQGENGEVTVESSVRKKLKVDGREGMMGNGKFVEHCGAGDPGKDGMGLAKMAQQKIMHDKLILNLIDNPKLLWKNLLAKVRNSWIERYLYQSKCYSKIKGLVKEELCKNFADNKTESNLALKRKINEKISR